MVGLCCEVVSKSIEFSGKGGVVGVSFGVEESNLMLVVVYVFPDVENPSVI